MCKGDFPLICGCQHEKNWRSTGDPWSQERRSMTSLQISACMRNSTVGLKTRSLSYARWINELPGRKQGVACLGMTAWQSVLFIYHNRTLVSGKKWPLTVYQVGSPSCVTQWFDHNVSFIEMYRTWLICQQRHSCTKPWQVYGLWMLTEVSK